MAFSSELADKVRSYLYENTAQSIEEKRMFGGLAFLVDDKMCVNIVGDQLMCRFDPTLQDELANKIGYLPMMMRGNEMLGYCNVEPEGFRKKLDFEFWLNICLAYNPKAQKSKKKK